MVIDNLQPIANRNDQGAFYLTGFMGGCGGKMGNGNVTGIFTPLIPRQRGTIRVHAYWQVIGGCVASGQRSNTLSVVWMTWAVETHSNASLQVIVPYTGMKVFMDAAERVPRWRGVGGWNGTNENYCRFTACIRKIKSAEWR